LYFSPIIKKLLNIKQFCNCCAKIKDNLVGKPSFIVLIILQHKNILQKLSSKTTFFTKKMLFLQSDFLHFNAFKKQTLQNYQKCEEFVK